MSHPTTLSHPTPEQVITLKGGDRSLILLFPTPTGYAAWDDDAPILAGLTGATLTSHASDRRISASFPTLKLDDYLRRIVEAGKRAAVCEQVRSQERPHDPLPRHQPGDRPRGRRMPR